MTAKILHLDIETAPIKGLVWQLWNNNLGIKQIHQDWFMLCYSAKWDGSDEVLYDYLPRYEDVYKKDSTNDRKILETLHALLDEADIVVAHNGQRFDVPKINARFFKHGILPPSPYKIVDTLLSARKAFNLTSNKLDYLARYLGIGAKKDVGDMERWEGCLAGNKADWDAMVEYNIHDVVLLEKVYKRMLPWIFNHPNLGLYTDREGVVCPKCGGTHLQRRGKYRTNAGVYNRYQCQDCGGWTRARLQEKGVKRPEVTNAI